MNTQQAFHAFWSNFSCNGKAIPACVRDQIPEPLQGVFPVITYSLDIDKSFAAAQSTAFLWMQEVAGESVNTMRLEVFSQIENAIPEGGARIDTDDGYMIIDRGAGFLRTYNPGEKVNAKTVYGGRIAYTVRFYR